MRATPEEIALKIFTLKVVHGHREDGITIEDWYQEQARDAFLAADLFLAVADAPAETGEVQVGYMPEEVFGRRATRS